MYLRTTSRSNRDGTRVSYYQLAHNFRDPDTRKVKAQIIHSFGRADRLDREQLVRLCRSIGRVCGLEVRDPLAGDSVRSEDTGDGKVLREGVTRVVTRTLGPLWVAKQMWERLGIGPTLRRIERERKLSAPYERALFAMTANRLCHPLSKLGVWERWLETVHLPSCWDLKLPQLYEAMDLLHDHIGDIEEAVFFRTADLFNLEVDVVFYDLTTCAFSIDEADNLAEGGLRAFGYNSEGLRTPQVVVALAVTREGLPVRSWVFPGNKTGMSTIQQIRKDLRGWKLGRALFVADSGMNSKENRDELARACGRYILATRAGSSAEVQKHVLSRQGRYKEIAPNLRAKEVVVGEGELRRRYIVCHNPEEARRQAAHRQQVLQEIEEQVSSHKTNSATAKWAITLLASGRYGRYLKVGRGDKIVIHRKAVRKAERMDGKWVLITNDDTLSVEDAATGYKSLLVIERCFRTLKRTEIKLSPVHHWLPRRIEAHVKICVLALLIERAAELTTGKTWSTMRHELEALQATEYQTDSHRFFHRNELHRGAAAILKALEVPPPKQVVDVLPVTQA